jgi:predicted patatin/cPLA2 family phospholipase
MSSVSKSILLLLVLVQGCASIPPRNPLPAESGNRAQIPGIPHARYWGDMAPPYTDAWLAKSRTEIRKQYPAIYGTQHHYLAISGGGANGAFGAGLLVGWSAQGTRPQFTMVTGISTGALSAPFAFLGSDYDDELKEVYTRYSTKDMLTKNSKLKTLTGDSIADTAPLRAMIARYIDDEVIKAIAREHRKGRILYIGTTNLDAQRPVIWNIGLIANSRKPGARDLIHDIMLASASVPVSFPPTMIEVEAKGQRYDEIHVDGGTTNQVFLYPLGIDWRRVEKKLAVKGTPQVYLIRNSILKPKWVTVERKLTPIAGRSVSSLIRTQGIGDMYRIYLGVKRDGLDYHLAYIPADFNLEPKEPFDPEYMGKLFELGYEMAKKGYPWEKEPPGM